MTQRWYSVVAICLGVALAGQLPGRARRAPRPVNLLFITLDTMRADRLPPYGFSGVDTPALDRIAAEGVVFDEAYAAVPLTLPSHASMFTGLYPPRVGVRDNAGGPVGPGLTTLAEVMREQGFRTAAFVASVVLAPRRGLDQGFETYRAGEGAGCGRAVPTRRRAGAVVDDTLSWLGANDAAPFFAWVHLYDTHRPFDLPRAATDAYSDPYVAAIAYEDSQIARVIHHLETRGLLDGTLVVITGDHGESLGGHGEDGHGIFVYQEALRVPLIIRGPGFTPGRVAKVARLVDVMPTVLEVFGMAARPLDGVSLAPAGRGEPAGEDADVYSESLYPKRFGWAPLHALRADRYKLIDAPRPELYDLSEDPGEERNVVAEHPQVAAAMRHRLRTFAADEGPVSSPDPEVLSRIASLGYVGTVAAAVTGATTEAADPKDRIAIFNDITRRQWENAERRRSLCR